MIDLTEKILVVRLCGEKVHGFRDSSPDAKDTELNQHSTSRARCRAARATVSARCSMVKISAGTCQEGHKGSRRSTLEGAGCGKG